VKSIVVIAVVLLLQHHSLEMYGQEVPVTTEQQLENLTDADQIETEDDNFLQELEQFRKTPVNINTAEADELKVLRFLTDLQIANLIAYRSLLGPLVSVYELQAVPGWDVSLLRKIIPFITVAAPLSLKEEAGKRFRGGEHSLLFRVSQVVEKSKGFDNLASGSKYLGSPQRFFFRYRYSYKNLLQYGIAGDKDAGEQFLKGAQKYGFDFYSFHLFARKIGAVQSLALGDFTVNMGQGLIQWQSLAFKKSADILGIKRQSSVLRPYNSAGEFNFHRGAGITIRKGKTEATVFASYRKLSANFVTDTVNQEDFISSFLSSGYNRTSSEVADRNQLNQLAFGGNIAYKTSKWHIGANIINYSFSAPVQKRSEPYNLYAISGKSWMNASIDYSFTHKNFHFFGEAAVDKNLDKAFINGFLISVDPRVDLSFVQRNINAGYQSINGNAYTENTLPTNETGFFSGIAIKPSPAWRIDAYADIFKFPWLKYLVDAPSRGTDFLAQLTYTPNKQVELYTRFRHESKQANQPDNTTPANFLIFLPKKSWRTQVLYKLNSSISLRNRAELLWYNNKGISAETGFLTYIDFIYKPLLASFSGVIRVQYFETEGYNSRIYAYENDVLYSYSIPAFFDKGFRYYVTFSYDLSKKLAIWVRLAQSSYKNKEIVGSGLDEIDGKRRTECKMQFRWLF
jgi:Helix-hairpin-helix motif